MYWWYHILLVVSLVKADIRYGPRCFNCTNRVDTTSCEHFQTCGTHEQCYMETKTDTMGIRLVTQGCRSKELCRIHKRESGVICSECCDGNYCNAQGCGYHGFEHNSQALGPLCLACDSTFTRWCLPKIERCLPSEVCYYHTGLVHNVEEIHTMMGCGSASTCANNINTCCHGDFCNDKYAFHGSDNQHSHAITTHLPTMQTTPPVVQHSNPQQSGHHVSLTGHWVTAQTSAKPETTRATQEPMTSRTTPTNVITSLSTSSIGVGPVCYDCNNVSHPSECTNYTPCGPQEKCAVQTSLNRLGVKYYWLGCLDQVKCSIPRIKRMKYRSLNPREAPVFSLCSECCDGQLCNYQGCGESGVRPVITYISPSITAISGNSYMLNCTATGLPTPIVEWNGPIHHGHTLDNVIVEPISNRMFINNIRRDNSGYYSCIANNGFGIDVKTVHVIVI